MNHIKWTSNQFKTGSIDHLSKDAIHQAIHFHSSMLHYEPTPLHHLANLSEFLGVNSVYVKDESKRFGLNAFKGLGASFAMACYFAKQLAIDLKETQVTSFIEQVNTLPKATFATVTAGNHGRGVAWAARLFGQTAKIYMPKGTSQSRVKAIENLGAEAYVSDLNYDDTVKHVAKLADENNWVLIQDTAWEGYEEIPSYIMQGYTTILAEIVEQLKEVTLNDITHVLLQAGVGSFAGAIAAAMYHFTEGHTPKIVIVEPSKADCLYVSALHPEGNPQRVDGELDSMMAGLACGEPNPVSWDILKSVSDFFFSCDDDVSAKGMRVLGNSIDQDPKVVSGESGAVTAGLLYELMTQSGFAEAKEKLGLDHSSNVLLISTEGDTDPNNYRKIVWG